MFPLTNNQLTSKYVYIFGQLLYKVSNSRNINRGNSSIKHVEASLRKINSAPLYCYGILLLQKRNSKTLRSQALLIAHNMPLIINLESFFCC